MSGGTPAFRGSFMPVVPKQAMPAQPVVPKLNTKEMMKAAASQEIGQVSSTQDWLQQDETAQEVVASMSSSSQHQPKVERPGEEVSKKTA